MTRKLSSAAFVLSAALLSASGNPTRSHWAFESLRRPPIPAVQNPPSSQNPIDFFITSKLRGKGLSLAQPASRRALIRRATFDLIGLPPTPEEVKAFVSDSNPDAYEKLVDRLLESPHFGERWGRRWLDVARYADSDGREGDGDRYYAYQYRDFVIKALNRDMPFDRFVRWQLAGDEYDPDNPLAVAATGFLAAGPCAKLPDNLLEEEKIRERYNDLEDMISTTGQAFLALTTGCARCHDHKYDPITIRDYYRMAAIFNSANRADVPLIPLAEIPKLRKAEAAWNEEMEAAKKEKNEAKIKALEARKPSPPTAFAMADVGPTPSESWLLDRGSMFAKKEKVQIGFISSLLRNRTVQAYWDDAKSKGTRKDTTYQRRALADWIVDVKNGPGALLARVAVNRLWQGHFGEGIVRTVNDFGKRSDRPSHPELLEWLAAELVNPTIDVRPSKTDESATAPIPWSLNRIHRLIVTSAAYRQSVSIPESAFRKASAIDPENRLLWHRRPRRMESEVYRDSLLAAARALNRQVYGPAFYAPIPKEANQARNVQSPYPFDLPHTAETSRRSIYMFHKRVVQHPLLQVFDGPDASTSCGRRNVTTVAPQALAVLNEPFIRLVAEDFARKIAAESGPEVSDRIKRAYLAALGRSPSKSEIESGGSFLERQTAKRAERDKNADARHLALADFAQVLFGLNEFMYVD